MFDDFVNFNSFFFVMFCRSKLFVYTKTKILLHKGIGILFIMIVFWNFISLLNKCTLRPPKNKKHKGEGCFFANDASGWILYSFNGISMLN